MNFRNIRLRWMAIDFCLWLVAALLGLLIRFELVARYEYLWAYLSLAAVAGLVQLVLGVAVHAYQGRTRTGSFDDFLLTSFLVGISTALAFLIGEFAPFLTVPRSAAIATGILALAGMLTARALYRLYREQSGKNLASAEPVILFGAGDVGEQLVKSIQLDSKSKWNVVALLDDDPGLGNLRIQGVPVVGTRNDIGKVSERTRAKTLIVSIARANSELFSDLSARCEKAGVHMLVLPSVSELITNSIEGSDVRELDEADLLGRTVVDTDNEVIADMLHGRRVLITGAGGSIGSELAHHIHPFGPQSLLLLDRDESALHAVQLSIYGSALMDSKELVLADIRDADRLQEVFDTYRPDIVFHAAALKHLPMLENAPAEGIKTNIEGTHNVLLAAQRVGVEAFINISTDKAADPCSVLGYTKRITERLTSEFDTRNTGRYISVRFGNVLGSRGSVLTTFENQIAEGKDITVTHRDITRYFMTIPEAVQLVLQASVVGRGGEVLILDMGEPVKIVDVAKQLIANSRQNVQIVFTGLREGEKLHEDLVAGDEHPTTPFHPKIMHVPVQPLGYEVCEQLPLAGTDSAIAELRTATGTAWMSKTS